MTMLTTSVAIAFPPNGKVLALGLDSKSLREEFENRVVFRNHWEVFLEKDVPRSIAAVCFSTKISPDHKSRIKSLLGRRDRPVSFHEEANPVNLRALLQKLLKNIELNIDPDKPQTERPSADTNIIMASPEMMAVAIRGAKSGVLELTPQEIEGAVLLDTKRIRPLKDQPRSYFNPKRLAELRDSIAAVGQIMPIIVRRIDDDPNFDYELIEGERRLRVCTDLEIPRMQAVIRTVTDSEQQFIMSFGANFAREGHTPLDTARGIAKILAFKCMENLLKTQQIKLVGRIAGRSDVWVYQHIKLLDLPVEIQELLEPTNDNDQSPLPLTMGTFIHSIAHRDIQLKVARATVAEKLSMAQAKHLARKLAIEAGLTAGSAERTPNKDYNIMRNYLRKTIEGADNLLDMPHRSLDELFAHRGADERREAVASIDKAIKLLNRLRSAVSLRDTQKKRA